MVQLEFNGVAMACILGYYALINIIMFAAMAIDKSNAVKNKRRIPEKNLYFLSILGGGLGGLIAMVVKNHKKRHIDFIMVFTITAILHILVAYLLVGKLVFGV